MDNFNIGELNFDELNTQIDELTKKLNTLSRGTDEYKNTLKSLGEVMAEQKNRQRDLNTEIKSNVEQNISLRTQIRKLRTELENTEQGTDKYKQVFTELTDKMREQKLMTEKLRASAGSLQNVFSNTLKTASSLSGGFTALSGIMTLFGTDNEEVAKTLQKLMALMAITTGLQQFSKLAKYVDLMKVSIVGMYDKWKQKAIEQVVANKTLTSSVEEGTIATKSQTVATEAGTKAYKASEVASAMCAVGIKAIGTAIKSVAIMAVISLVIEGIMKIVSTIKEHNAEAEKMKNVVTASARAEKDYNSELNKSRSSYESNIQQLKVLQLQYSSYIKAGKDKKKVIEELKPALEKATGATYTLKQAEQALTSKNFLKTFINAEVAKAKAVASLNTLVKASTRLDELNNWYNYYSNMITKINGSWYASQQQRDSALYMPTNARNQYKKQIEEQQKVVDQLTDRTTRLTIAESESNKELSKYGKLNTEVKENIKKTNKEEEKYKKILDDFKESITKTKDSLKGYYDEVAKDSKKESDILQTHITDIDKSITKEKEGYESGKISFKEYSDKIKTLYKDMYDSKDAIINKSMVYDKEMEDVSYNNKVKEIKDEYNLLKSSDKEKYKKDYDLALEKMEEEHQDKIKDIINKGEKEKESNTKENDKNYLSIIETDIDNQEKLYKDKIEQNKTTMQNTIDSITNANNDTSIFNILFGDFDAEKYIDKIKKINAEILNIAQDKQVLEDKKTYYTDIYNQLADSEIEAKKRVKEEITKIEGELTENMKKEDDARLNSKKIHAEMIKSAYESVTNAVSSSIQGVIDNNDASLAETQTRLKKQLDAGQITKEEYDKKNLKAQQKTNEKNKKYEAGLAMIQGIEGSVAVLTQSIKAYPAPYGAIIGGVSAAAVMASTVASIRKIYAQQVSDSSSSSVSTSASEGASSPLIYSTQLTSSSQQQQINEQQKAQKVYVVESDITNAQKKVQVVQNDNTF